MERIVRNGIRTRVLALKAHTGALLRSAEKPRDSKAGRPIAACRLSRDIIQNHAKTTVDADKNADTGSSLKTERGRSFDSLIW